MLYTIASLAMHLPARTTVALLLLSSCAGSEAQYPWLTLDTAGRTEVLLESRELQMRTIDLGDTRLEFVEIVPEDWAPPSPEDGYPDDALPWVVVHGIGGSMGDLTPLLPMNPRHRIIAVNLPGYGGSRAREHDYSIPKAVEALTEFVAHLELPRAHYVCHSLGGHTCIGMLLEHPELAESLAVISPSGVYDNQELIRSVHEDFAGINAGKAPAIVAAMFEAARPKFDYEPLAWLSGYKPKRLAVWTVMKDHYRGQLHRLEMPTLIVWGIDDPLFEVHNAFHMKAMIRGSELRLADIDHHSPQFTHPRIVARWVRGFIDRVEGRDG